MASSAIFYVYSFSISEAVTQRYSVRKMFLKISQNSQEGTFVGVSFLVKLQTSLVQDLKGIEKWNFKEEGFRKMFR